MPRDEYLPREKRLNNTPTPTRGRATALIFSFNPIRDTIQPVLVVPRFEPNITPTAWGKVSSPALTKPMVVRVVALEDCMRAVVPAPDRIADKVPPVKRLNPLLKASPARAFRPLAKRVIPRRNTPIPPKTFEKTCIMLPLHVLLENSFTKIISCFLCKNGLKLIQLSQLNLKE
jgi:hypothetical protein